MVVFREGKEAGTVYMVKRGRAVISTRDGGKLAERGAGAIFGELCLIGKRAKRNATVTASGELRLLALDGKVVVGNPELDEWCARAGR